MSDRGGAFAFASEVRALRGSEILDPAALLAYLVFGYVPEPITVVRGVTAVAPGTLVRVRGSRIRVERFWEESSAWPSGQREIDRARFGGLLRDAVESAIEGEDDVGILVDGSPASAALLALVRPMLGRGLRTHVFHFGSARDDGATRGARGQHDTVGALAEWFRGEHREHQVDGSAIASAFAAATAADQPSTGATLCGARDRRDARRRRARVALGARDAPACSAGIPRVWSRGSGGPDDTDRRAGSPVPRRACWALRRPFGRAAALADTSDRATRSRRRISPRAASSDPMRSRGCCVPMRSPMRERAFDAAAHVDARALAPLGPPCVLPAASAQVAIERAVAAMDLAGPLMSGALRDAEASAVTHGLALRAPFLDHRLHEWLTTGGRGPRSLAARLRVLEASSAGALATIRAAAAAAGGATGCGGPPRASPRSISSRTTATGSFGPTRSPISGRPSSRVARRGSRCGRSSPCAPG